jgi:phosphoribosylanthranilate isomerase
MVAGLGANMIGLNFYKPSPRYIDPQPAAAISHVLRETYGDTCPILVGVFANAPVSDMSRVMEKVGLDFVQLSGDESAEVLRELRGVGIKALRPPNKALAIDDIAYYREVSSDDPRAPSFVLDAYHPKLYGGTGASASVEVALAVKMEVPRLMLAGGLDPSNVAERVRAVRPWGVDVASGVEDEVPGIKSAEKVRVFIEAANSA